MDLCCDRYLWQPLAGKVNYPHIKVCLTMLDLGLSTEEILGSQSSEARDPAINTANLSQSPNHGSQPEVSHTEVASIEDPPAFSSSNYDRPLPNIELGAPTKQPRDDESPVQETPMKKFYKGNELVESFRVLEATESAILGWLEDRDGALLSDIVDHFNGSEEDFVVGLLRRLEGEFLIFRKDGLFRTM